MARKKWTIRELNFLREYYPEHGASYCAEHLERTPAAVTLYANKNGIKYEGEHKGRFQKGLTPWNKGKSYNPRGSQKGRFKAGHTPSTTRELGEVYIRDEKGTQYKYIKHAKDKKPIPLHRHLWQQAHGEIPPGHIVVFKDGDTMNCVLENLDCITRAEHARRIAKSIDKQTKYRASHSSVAHAKHEYEKASRAATSRGVALTPTPQALYTLSRPRG